MRVTLLTSIILTALTTTVAARARVPRSLLVGLKRQAATTPVIPEVDGGCTYTQTACGSGGQSRIYDLRAFVTADRYAQARDAAKRARNVP